MPQALAVRANPDSESSTEHEVRIRLQTTLDDSSLSVRLTLLAGSAESPDYEVDLVGVWKFDGQAPQDEEIDSFVNSHALPRISAAINLELSTLGSRVKKPYPILPDNLSELV